MLSFVFHFHKIWNMEYKIKELQNQLLKKMKINLMIVFICMVDTFFKSKFVSSPLRSSATKWSRGHQESAV